MAEMAHGNENQRMLNRDFRRPGECCPRFIHINLGIDNGMRSSIIREDMLELAADAESDEKRHPVINPAEPLPAALANCDDSGYRSKGSTIGSAFLKR